MFRCKYAEAYWNLGGRCMNRNEFLEKLKAALENDLSGPVVQENINYYNQYITEETANGKSEQEVLELLGDPWMLARTIIDSPVNSGGTYTYEPNEQPYANETRQTERQRGNGMHILRLDTWWKKLLVVLCVVGILGVIVSLVTGIISLLAPIALPVIMILIIMQIVRRK